MLVLDLAKASERASLSVVWTWATPVCPDLSDQGVSSFEAEGARGRYYSLVEGRSQELPSIAAKLSRAKGMEV